MALSARDERWVGERRGSVAPTGLDPRSSFGERSDRRLRLTGRRPPFSLPCSRAPGLSRRHPAEKKLCQRQIEATDQEIDAPVCELYGLAEEEIAIVEGRDH